MQAADPKDNAQLGLFGEEPLAAFTAGQAVHLVTHRNRQLGNLLGAERAVYYVQILYRMLLFRRDHDLEPLYDDIYAAVRPAQEEAGGGDAYSQDQFRIDLNQLENWNLVTCRIEAERLRGYTDTRRRKFRYRLEADTVAFVEWLESRLQEELESPDNDTRDLLEEVAASLRELLRLLLRFKTADGLEGDARRITYHLIKLDELGLTISGNLANFNARLLGFVLRRYELQATKRVLSDLDHFVDHFLRQIHHLRGEIVELIDNVLQAGNRQKLRACMTLFEEERRDALPFMSRPPELRGLERVPIRLREFYRADGRLDGLCRRIRESAIRVWRKLHSHLRELERRSARVDDLRERIAELATLPPEAVPHTFFLALLEPAVMRGDQQYWDAHELADPPQPRRRPLPNRPGPPPGMRRKQRGSGPVVSMEHARLEALRHWLRTTVGEPTAARPQRVSQGAYTEFDDFGRILELAKAAYLAEGKKLKHIRYRIATEAESMAEVTIDKAALAFQEMLLSRLPG